MTFVKETPAGQSDDHDMSGVADGGYETGAASTTAYPVPRPSPGGDTRSIYGIAMEVGAVLTRQGYPEMRVGADLVRVQQALFDLIYGAAAGENLAASRRSPQRVCQSAVMVRRCAGRRRVLAAIARQ
jgi:hypothetical protein